MSLVTRKHLALICAVGASTYLAACGDSNSEPDARIANTFDAAGPDAAPPDAKPPDQPVSGTVAVVDIDLVNLLGPAHLTGSAVAVSFTDPDSDKGKQSVFCTTGPCELGTSPVGKCVVHVYDVT